MFLSQFFSLLLKILNIVINLITVALFPELFLLIFNLKQLKCKDHIYV